MTNPQDWGVDLGYRDSNGHWREPPTSTVEAILASMGAGDSGPRDDGHVIVCRQGAAPDLGHVDVVLEDGTRLEANTFIPADIPIGYHRLEGEREASLIVSPGRCPAPPFERAWGWSAQLYAVRSGESWGMGDLSDLSNLAGWSASSGAQMLLLNPLHACSPGPHPEASPYFASSRCFLNPLYLRIEQLPGASDLPGLETLAAVGQALSSQRLIDRDKVWALKSEALEAIFERFEGDAGFDDFVAERGQALLGFATFNALAERFALPYQTWPSYYRHPGSPEVEQFVKSAEGSRRVKYHCWLQWHLDRQLSVASAHLGLVQDLAIGVNAGGADAWLWQDVLAPGMRVGAPSDDFNTLGQDWGLPPWDPWKLRANAYEPFIQTIRSGLSHAGGLRFDHVMGLFRLFWIPDGESPVNGTYVRYLASDMLDILALEASRAGAYIVGEDLGTVEDQVRKELYERGVLSYKLLWFEPQAPRDWPHQTLGAVTTHDLPTVAGVWSGADIAAQRDLDLAPNEEGAASLRQRLSDWTQSEEQTPPQEVILRSYKLLSEAPCAVLTATLDDALAVQERPNMPGTIDQWPNWSLALPALLEDIKSSELARQISAELSARSSSSLESESWGGDSSSEASSGQS